MEREIYVFDACALIAFLNNEDGAENAYMLLEKAGAGQIALIMSAVNLCEVFYDCLRGKGMEMALQLLQDIRLLPLNIFREIGDDLITEASRFKIEWKVSLADAFALGLAHLTDGKLVSTDHHEFDTIAESKLVQFYWLR